MPNEFDWNDLKFFLALVRRKKMVAAAMALKVDHTTVSRRIARLESGIGAKLFFKDGEGYQLTAAGEDLLPLAMQVANASAEVLERIGGEAHRLSGSVRLGAPDGIGTFFIAPRLSRFQDQHPDLDVELIIMPRYFNLSRHEAHLSIALSRPESGRLLSRKLTDYSLQFYASESYLQEHGRPETTRDLRDHKLIGYIDDILYASELRYIETLDKELNVRFRSSSIIAQRQAILAGTGIGVLPRFFTKDDSRLVPVLEDQFHIQRTIWLLSHEDTAKLSRIRAISDFLADEAKRNRDLFLAE